MKNMNLKIGRAAALAVLVETLVFAFSLLWGLFFHSLFDQLLSYVASLLLAVSVVILMACFHDRNKDSAGILSLLALASAIMYAVFCDGNYFLQLSIVALNPLGLSREVMQAIAFLPGSPTFALDMLGYFFLCLSTLAAGFALDRQRERPLRFLCILHGALALPTILAPILSGIFMSGGSQANDVGSYVLLFWCAIFAPLAWYFMRYFASALEQE